jgi:large subunit ribosomal protein L35Ae
MKGIIVNYRQGRHTQNPYQMIVKIETIISKEQAEKLVGTKVVWKTPTGKEIAGKITSAHGNKGVVRVRFEKGMPGQAIGSEILVK